jgi:hypothetical protein
MPGKNSRWARLAQDAKARARLKGLPLKIDRHWVRRRVEGGACQLTGIRFVNGESRSLFAPSLDRIDPSRGYTPDNIQVILWGLNAAKGASSTDEFLCFLRAVSEAMHGRA